MRRLTALLLLLACLLSGCGQRAAAPEAEPVAPAEAEPAAAEREKTGSMDLIYAEQFQVDYFSDGTAEITIAENDRYLLVPAGCEVPDTTDTVLQQPLDCVYLAASSAMDFYRQIGALDTIRLTSTTRSNWSIPEVLDALDSGAMIYAGKYGTPDYELVLSEGTDVAIESTMIYHNPETKEQLEKLGIPVLVERSSYETHPLGRLEWIKLYGLLCGKTEEAETYFDEQVAKLDGVLTQEQTDKTVAFFYISSGGYAVVRKPGDYVSRMIGMAGGAYVPAGLEAEENALSTMNMEMEAFYAAARDADYLIYNASIDGELETVDQLLEKSGLLANFKAVQSGDVWCTGKNMFQQTTCITDMLVDLHAVITGQADGETELTYLHRLR